MRRGTPYNCLYVETPPERGTFCRLKPKRVGISLNVVYERVGKAVRSVKGPKRASLSVTQSKHLLVCDRDNDRIQVFYLDGNFIGKFDNEGDKLGELCWPYAVAVGSNDQIVVSE